MHLKQVSPKGGVIIDIGLESENFVKHADNKLTILHAGDAEQLAESNLLKLQMRQCFGKP